MPRKAVSRHFQPKSYYKIKKKEKCKGNSLDLAQVPDPRSPHEPEPEEENPSNLLGNDDQCVAASANQSSSKFSFEGEVSSLVLNFVLDDHNYVHSVSGEGDNGNEQDSTIPHLPENKDEISQYLPDIVWLDDNPSTASNAEPEVLEEVITGFSPPEYLALDSGYKCNLSPKDGGSEGGGNLHELLEFPETSDILSGWQTPEKIQGRQNTVNWEDAVVQLNSSLPPNWIPIRTEDGVNILKLSSTHAMVTQRSIYVKQNGATEYYVHGRLLPAQHDVYLGQPEVNVGSTKNTVGSVLQLVSKFRLFDICQGVSKSKFSHLWKRAQNCYIDNNEFQEIRYTRRCRSLSCTMVVNQSKRMCSHCSQISKNFSQKKTPAPAATGSKLHTPHKSKPLKYLTTPEIKARTQRAQKTIENLKKKNERLKAQLDNLIKTEGIAIDDELGEDLHHILQETCAASEDTEIPTVDTPTTSGDSSVNRNRTSALQKLFLQQQLEACKKTDLRQVRWHPLVIRLALEIKMISSSAYSVLRSSGFLKLPSERTLFDYSHVMDIKEGCCWPIIDDISKNILSFKYSYQQYHVLMVDEVNISQNLVHKKSTGEIVGYCKLDEVQQEFMQLEHSIKDLAQQTSTNLNSSPPIAKKMLVYMVKGTASSVEGVVASFGVSSLTKEDMYSYTWEVIEALEVKNVKVVAIVCDGSAVNRGFIDLHPPVTKLPSGVVFDTMNMYSPARNIYFFQIPHT